MSLESVKGEMERIAEMFKPRHIVYCHPENEERVTDVARGYLVRVETSEHVPRDRVYMVDLKALEDLGYTPTKVTL